LIMNQHIMRGHAQYPLLLFKIHPLESNHTRTYKTYKPNLKFNSFIISYEIKMNTTDIIQSAIVQNHSLLIKESYELVCGKPFPITCSVRSLAEELYHSKFIVLSHGMEKDPVFNYANLAAQALWKLDWEEFTRLPSRLSARVDKAETREQALEEAFRQGYIHSYEGIRIDALGKEFYIQDVTLWNLIDANGIQHGQTAMFDRWEYVE
jgi:hypothetical protein